MTFTPDNPRRKALVAMSGGVDSSVAAYLAAESGLDCIGVTMKLFDNEDAGISRELDAKNFNFIAFDDPPAEFRASAGQIQAAGAARNGESYGRKHGAYNF